MKKIQRFRRFLTYFRVWLTMPVTWKQLMAFDKVDQQIDKVNARKANAGWN